MRTAVVTGGASGIGRALATALSGRGVHVTVADIDTGRAEKVASGLENATAAGLDVTDAGAVAELMRSVKAEQGRLDLVFNNAGIGVGGAADELTLDHWNRTIDINLRGVI